MSSAGFTIEVTGDIETVAYFRRIANDIDTFVAIPAMRDWATALRDAMLKREHWRSGRMKAMTKITSAGKYWAVIVAVGYAEQENMRKGDKRGERGGGQGTPHRFVEPSIKDVEKSQQQNFLARLNAFLAQP